MEAGDEAKKRVDDGNNAARLHREAVQEFQHYDEVVAHYKQQEQEEVEPDHTEKVLLVTV